MTPHRECLVPRHRRPKCGTCGDPLDPAPAWRDGEATYVGYLPCPAHPHAPTIYPPHDPPAPPQEPAR